MYNCLASVATAICSDFRSHEFNNDMSISVGGDLFNGRGYDGHGTSLVPAPWARYLLVANIAAFLSDWAAWHIQPCTCVPIRFGCRCSIV